LNVSNKPYPLNKIKWLYNIRELIEYSDEKFGANNAFTYEDDNGGEVNISFNRFKREITALGASFYSSKIKNEKIAILGETSYLWILSYFAGVNGGNAIVPLDKNLPATNLEALIKDSEAAVLIYSDDFVDVANKIKTDKLRLKFNIKTDVADMIEAGKKLVAGNSEHAKEFIDYKLDSDKLAAIIYTSGTTGVSKGVMLSHKNMMSDMCLGVKNVEISGRELLLLPLHHSFSFTACILAAIYFGCNIAINKSLKNVLNDLQKYKPDCVLLVPLFVETFYKRIWQGAIRQKKDKLLGSMINMSNFLLKFNVDLRKIIFKSVLKSAFGGNLDTIITGGAPIDEKYIKGFREFGVNIMNGYGITECSPIVAVNRNGYYKDGSVGLVLSEIKIKILDPDEDGCGEICVQGDIVMMGYYNNPEATKDAFFEGSDGKWFKTGDIGKVDEDNFLYISGRKKNLIILNNGENVSPEGLEQEILNEYEYVKEVVCFQENNLIAAEVFFNMEYIEETGTQDVNYGDKLNEDIVIFNRKQPPQKNIGKIIVRNIEFPKTTTLKIKRIYK
jgi:long-chain acyl-CoA synthetase